MPKSFVSRQTSSLIKHASPMLLEVPPKRIILSGPSGFLGQRVLECILKVHQMRSSLGLKPGELILLSSKPGNLMGRLAKKYGEHSMKTIRASRVDYYSQHDPVVWKDNFLSLGLEGEDCVFVNLAAVAGPKKGIKDALMDVNYKAPVAAAQAACDLKFGHWVQSSTQATRADRAGQAVQKNQGIPSSQCGLHQLRTDAQRGIYGQLEPAVHQLASLRAGKRQADDGQSVCVGAFSRGGCPAAHT